jgi:hypothetical protein
MDGRFWIPYQLSTFPTPPFPEFISGHSAFSAAGATVLRVFTGSDRFGSSVTLAAGSSRIEPGDVGMGNIHWGRESGRPLAAVRRNPLRDCRPPGQSCGTNCRTPGLEKSRSTMGWPPL